MNASTLSRRFTLFFAALSLTPLLASAAPTPIDFKVLIDADNNETTGCTVVTTGGLVKGVDHVLTTSVSYDTVAGTAVVTGVTRQACSSSTLNTFTSALPVDTTGWPVGVGAGGLLTVETHIPMSALGGITHMHLAFTAVSGAIVDGVVVDDEGEKIIWPPMPEGRRHVAGLAGTRVITLDGADGDWVGVEPLPLTFPNGSSPSLRYTRVRMYFNQDQLYFVMSAQANANAPTANDDTYSVERGKSLGIGIPGVLANDTDPNHKPLTAVLISGSGTHHGSLTLNPDGSFNYMNDGSPAPSDSFEYKANNGSADSNAAHVDITITEPNAGPPPVAPKFTNVNHTTFTVGTFGSFTFTTTPVNPASTVSLQSGALPAGVSFSAIPSSTTGKISGTPAPGSAGVYTLHMVADNHVPPPATQTFTLTVCNIINVGNPATSTATANAAFSQTFTQTGAFGTATFSLNSGSLPTGLTLSSGGVLSGTPTVTGSFPITVKVTDQNGCSGVSSTYTLVVNCQTITVNNPATNTGTVNAAFSQTFTATNAIGGTTFSLNSGTLPAGITLAANGTLSGTPTQAGSFPITVKVTDANGCTGVGATYTLTIGCQTITVNNPGVNSGTVNVAFSQTFTASNTIGALTFSTASTLPAGLTLSSGGVLSGTPTQTGTFPIVVHVVDGNGCSGNGPTYNLTINCQVVTVNNPGVNSGTVNVAFNQTFTASNAIGAVTFSTASTLPTGLTLSSGGVLSGTPTQTGTFPIVVHAVDANGCGGNGATYNLTINCQVISVTNPGVNSGTVNTAFSQSFTAGNTIGAVTFSTASTLPTGLTLSSGGVLSGTPTQTGTFPIVVHAVDANGCSGNGPTYNLTIGCQVISVTNPGVNTGTVNSAFSQTFTAGNTIGTVTFTTASTLPAGLTLATNGTLSGVPLQTGTFPIVVHATDANGCSGNGATYNLTIGCQVITVTNPANNTGTANAAFSEQFTAGNTVGTVTFTTASTLPTGLTLSAAGVLSGTPTQTGTFPIVVHAVDANGCSGNGPTYNLTINCQTITVTNPANANGTVSAPFSEQFSQTGAIGTATFATASTLPTGVTLSSSGLLAGTPTVPGVFPIVVTVTDSNGCTGTGATYNLTINCQTITVTNPANTTGTANAAFSEQFNQSGAVGGATFSTVSTLPAGLTLSSSGLLSGTPTQVGTFPITVTVTDGNGCTGTGPAYNLTINCQSISVTNPATNTGVANAAFSQTFTQSGAIGGATFTTSSVLPTGLTLSTGGVLSGTPTQVGTFPIVVTVTDGNGCTGSGATYNLTINCQTISVTNPGVNSGTAGSAFSQTFTQSGAIGGATFTTSSTLPAGLTLSTGGVLSGTPTQVGTFPIVVTVTDNNGCTGTGATYNLTINCQTITVTNPATNTGTVSAAFSQQFTASNTIGTTTFSTASTLPNGITLSSSGLLSGTPTQKGTFPIVVTATDANGCTGSGATYNLTINCQTITVTNPATTSGTVSAPFSAQFTQSGAVGTATFSTASSLPAGITLSTTGLLSGTPTQPGCYPIIVTVTDSNGCTGSSVGYILCINCQVITVNNPTSNSNPAGTPLVAANFTFTQSGAIGGATFTTASPLPTGVTLTTGGVLTGTPTQGGSFPITVTVTDGNGCTGNSSGYILTITCPVITVTNPGVNTGTAGVAFSQTFTQSGGQGTITWSESGTLPSGITLNTSTGVLSGTTQQVGTFPITVTATDQNGCQGTGATYNLTINCQTVSVTNPATNTGTVDAAFTATFTATGILGTVTWSETGTLPAGISLNSATGVLSGTPTQQGTFPITVTATDTNGCSGSSPYTLTINCQTITVTNPATNTGTVDAAFSKTFTQSGAHLGIATFTLASGSLPSGLSLSSGGVLSGTPTQPGSFPIVVRATDGNGCFGDGPTYTIVINCQTITVTNPGVNTGTTGQSFSQQFTQSGAGAHIPVTWSFTGTLPTGFSLDPSTGILSGTTQQHGSFPITVKAADTNGCFGTSPYTLTINCQTITVTNPANTGATVGSPYSEQFTQSGGLNIGTGVWSESGTLPTGITFNTSTGVLSGVPTQSGSFPIVVTFTDGNGCQGSGPTYTLVVACNVITVNNPATNTGTAGQAFTATFTQTGGNGTIVWSKTGTLPSGISLNSSTGVLSGTTSTTGSFPITVTATDANGCQGSNNYTLTINCQTITVTNPGVNQGTAGVAFSQTFTVSGILGTVSWSETGSLPSGITLNSATGVLSGTTSQTGSFPITVKATDTNGCFGTSSYTLTIICQTITVTNPGTASGTVGIAFSQTFTSSGILGTPTWSIASGTLPTGLSLNSASGVLSGTPTQTGSFPITVKVTDTNGCSGTGATYNLSIVCPTITVSRTGGGSFPQGTFNTVYSGQSVTAAAVPNNTPTFTFAVTAGALPTGLSLNSSTGAITGTPTATGTFGFTVTATDQYGCTGSQAFSIAIKPNLGADSYSNLVNNTQEVITGGTTASPATPFTFHATKITANDTPAVTLTTGTFATTAGGSITIAADGTFIYTPPINQNFGAAGDTYTYTASSDTGGTGTPVSATATITFNFANRVWYVSPNAALAGDGRSNTPFNNTSLIPSLAANDIVFVYNHSTPANAKSKISLNANNTQLIGQGVNLVVNGFTLVTATSAPSITNSTASAPRDVVSIGASNGVTISGVTLTSSETGAGANAASLIVGTTPAGLTVSNSTLTTSGAGCTSHGIKLGAATGTITISSVTFTGASTGDMVQNTGGTSTWSFTSSPITQTAGRAINFASKTGGGASFDAASPITVSAGTVDGAITLSTNSGGETFTLPKVTITVSGAGIRGLVASNSGTVTQTDNTSTLTASGGAALDFQNTTIGAGNLKFRSISATGGTNGILLNTTGASGSLQVVGNAGTCTTTASTCTGGTIQNTTGHAISLTSTLSPSFSFMKIQNIATSGIFGTTVTNFTLDSSVIDGVNTSHTGADANVAFNTGVAGTENNVSGTVSITNNHLNNSYQAGIDIQNYSGTISSLTITNNNLVSSTVAANSLGTAINVVANRGAGNHANITAGSISSNTITNFPTGAGIQVIGGNSNSGQAVTIASVGSPFVINGNTITGPGPGASGMGTNGIAVTAGESTTAYFQMGAPGAANNITNVRGNGIACSLFGNGTEKCIIQNNTITANNTAGSPGINTGADQSVAGGSAGVGTLYLDIHNNTVSGTTGNGILSTIRSVSSSGVFYIQNNNVSQPTVSSGTVYGIRVDSGNGTGSPTVCLKIAGNTTTGSTNGGTTAPGIGIRQSHADPGGGIGTFQIFGLSPTPSNDAQMEAYVGNAGQNPGSANGTFGATGVSSISGGGTFTANSCTIP